MGRLRPESGNLLFGPVVAAHNEEAEPPDLLGYWRAIYKRKWGIIALTIAVVLVATLNVYSKTPRYLAKSTLLIEPNSTRFSPVNDDASGYFGYYQSLQYINTQKEIITSRSFIEAVVDRRELWKHPFFTPSSTPRTLAPIELDWRQWIDAWFPGLIEEPSAAPAPSPEQLRNTAIELIKGGLSVTLIEDTQLMRIGFESSDPVFSAEVSNAVGEVFIQYDLESRLDSYRQATEWLTGRTAGIREKLRESESRLQAYREQEDLVNLEGGASTVQKQLSEVFSRLIAAQRERKDLEVLQNNIDELEKKSPVVVADNPALVQNDAVRSSLTSYRLAQAGFNEVSARYGPKHPNHIAARSELSAATSLLAKEVTLALAAVSQNYKIASEKEAALQTEFDRLREESQQLTRKLFEVGTLEQEVEANRGLYDLFVERFKETDIASQLDTPSARVIEAAVVPVFPVWPNPPQTILIAALAGVLFGSLIALLLERLDNTLKNGDDVEERLGLAHLVALPTIETKEGTRPEMAFEENPDSMFSEAIRTLRTSVLLSGLDNPHKIVAVTSTVPSEGKTTIAINLALALAHLEKVLLVDADMRRASVGQYFGIGKDAPGLSNLVAATEKDSDCIVTHEESGLQILPAGLIPPNPQELLSSRRFREVLQKLSAEYDRIVIDTAPTGAVSDALLVASKASATLFVVRADSTPVEAARNGIKRLNQADSHVVGVVLNQAAPARARYYSYNKYYSPYYSSGYGGKTRG